MKTSIRMLLLAAMFSLSFSFGRQSDSPAVGSSGMASSAHHLATEAGIRILKAGGNAFDAAVAIAAALNVVEPDMSGMGGYGTILIYDARKGESRFLNPSGRIPLAVNSDAFRAPTPYFEMDIQQAIAAGRISFYEPDELGMEESIPASVREQLAKLGHKIRVVAGIGNAHGLTIEYDSARKPVRFTGAADPRGEGKAIGY